METGIADDANYTYFPESGWDTANIGATLADGTSYWVSVGATDIVGHATESNKSGRNLLAAADVKVYVDYTEPKVEVWSPT